MKRLLRVLWRLTVIMTVIVAAPQMGRAQGDMTGGGRILLDDTFAHGHTGLPLQRGVLYLDGHGYAMYDAVSNPRVVVARPDSFAPLPTAVVSADLAGLRGPRTAPFGIDLLADDSEYVFEIRPSGQYRVQRVDGARRATLLGWTASATIKRGHAVNRLATVYAAGLLQLFINGTIVGWAQLPGAPRAMTPGLINDGSKTAATLVRCTHFQVREGPVVTLDDAFKDHNGAWPQDHGKSDYQAGGYDLRTAAHGAVETTAVPGATAPSDDFTLDTALVKISGADNKAFGVRFLEAGGGSVAYLFLIDGAGAYAVFRYAHGYTPLVAWTPTPALRHGNARNELFVRYGGGTVIVGANGVILRQLALSGSPLPGLAGLSASDNLHIRCTHFLLAEPIDAPGIDPLQPAPLLPAGNVALTDDFADNHNDWYTDTNTFMQDHAYHLRDTNNDSAYRGWAQQLQLDNAYSFAATVRLVGGSALNYGYGLVFLDHSTDADWDLYSFDISGIGQYSLWRSHNASWTPVIPWTKSDLVARGYSSNRLRVDVLRSVVALYLNGRHLVDARLPDVELGHGTVGFITSNRIHIAVSQARVTTLIGNKAPIVVKPRPSPTPTPAPTPVPKTNSAAYAANKVLPSVVRIAVRGLKGGGESVATGFLIQTASSRPFAYVLTAGHTVRNVNSNTVRTRLTVITQRGWRLSPVDMAYLPSAGEVAVVKVRSRPGLKPARLGSSAGVQIEDRVMAAGYLGQLNGGDVQSNGAPSDVNLHFGQVQRTPSGDNPDLITDANVAEGMSGGPLVFVNPFGQDGVVTGLDGCVVGINDAYLVHASGFRDPNIDIHLPTDAVLPAVNRLLAMLGGHPLGASDLCQ